jgi:hypothetical protein
MDPDPIEIDPLDIAHALSMLCRYNGHVDRFYSVAEHCILMSNAVPAEDALWALLHDATEAYVGDMIRPLKRFMPDYIVVENRLMEAIASRFGLTGPMPSSVKDADNRILLTERAALLSVSPAPWGFGLEDLEPLPVFVSGWAPEVGQTMYLDRLGELLI